MKYWSPGDPGHCHHITHHADAYGPAEYCENDTAPNAMYCPTHQEEDDR